HKSDIKASQSNFCLSNKEMSDPKIQQTSPFFENFKLHCFLLIYHQGIVIKCQQQEWSVLYTQDLMFQEAKDKPSNFETFSKSFWPQEKA
ncbi:MAG: hypothetical protein AAF764_11220, partial [Pseudomonadota bacterium]